MARLTEAEHARVSAAVAAAEAGTDGEIVTVVSPASDPYHDVALHYAVVAMLAVTALVAVFPELLAWLAWPLTRGWAADPSRELVALMAAQAIAFLLARWLLAWRALRLRLTPAATKARRVRRRALALFRAGVEARTDARTGVLLYLSLDEHLAELVADAGIHGTVPPEQWGEAMVALVDHARAGRIADGMAEAVAQVGAILAQARPRQPGDVNELSDRLIEL